MLDFHVPDIAGLTFLGQFEMERSFEIISVFIHFHKLAILQIVLFPEIFVLLFQIVDEAL